MIKHNFRTVGKTEVKVGLAVWLDGKSFEDTNPVGPGCGIPRDTAVCGPFLVNRVLFTWRPEPRVNIIDPATGRNRSMMCSWLLVPKEEK